MPPMDPSDALNALLRTFRDSFYDECFLPRADALFELTDALLTADVIPSPAHSSLQPSHRRGWGSLYAALDRGRIEGQALRRLLARHPLAGGGETPVYAVHVSVWPRCDAESSPERGYYYPSRHSAGQPIVAGWAYRFIARLIFLRESWTAPADVQRVPPTQDANTVAVEQVKRVARPLAQGRGRGSTPVRLRRGLRSREIATGARGEPRADPG